MVKPSRLAAAIPAGKTPLLPKGQGPDLGRVGPARPERRRPRPVVQALAQPLDHALAGQAGQRLRHRRERHPVEVGQPPDPLAAGFDPPANGFGGVSCARSGFLLVGLHVGIITVHGRVVDCSGLAAQGGQIVDRVEDQRAARAEGIRGVRRNDTWPAATMTTRSMKPLTVTIGNANGRGTLYQLQWEATVWYLSTGAAGRITQAFKIPVRVVVWAGVEFMRQVMDGRMVYIGKCAKSTGRSVTGRSSTGFRQWATENRESLLKAASEN